MNQQKTQLKGLTATITAHQDEDGSFLLVSLTSEESQDDHPRTPLKTALVIDRSGSMSGDSIAITRASAAQFIRSLSPDDRVGVVVYDDQVDLVSGMEEPSESMARKVSKIGTGGSTNLYEGWLTGAKLVGRGGRVILLSDGQANVGRFVDAHSLAAQAAITYQKFGVTTTTIGVGRGYDEALMAGMARQGGGSHYFADAAPSITDAFSHERYALDETVLESVSVRLGKETQQFGHFWGGETKARVFRVADLAQAKATVRFTAKVHGGIATEELTLPREFGYSEDVRLERLLLLAADEEGKMVSVRDPKSASEMKEGLRAIVMKLLAHPASDQPNVQAVIDRLKASLERLAQLERHYTEEEAVMHRKRSLQSSHNLSERAKAFSAFDDELDYVAASAAMAAPSMHASGPLVIDPSAFSLADLEEWIQWRAVPILLKGKTLTVALENPKQGFVTAEIQKRTGLRVKAVFAGANAGEIMIILRQGR